VSSQSFSCFVLCFPLSHRSDLPLCFPKERPSSLCQAPLQLGPTEGAQQNVQLQGRLLLWLLAADGMPWNPSLSHFALLGPDAAVLRCLKAPPSSPPSPEAPSVDGVTEPLSPLEHPSLFSGESSASFSLLHKPATLLHCFPFIGTPSMFDACDFFSAARCGCFICQPRRASSKTSNSNASKPSSYFDSSEPCTADGMVSRSSAVSKARCGALQELLTASRQPASSIMLSTLNRQ
jgi:hypothetical protein